MSIATDCKYNTIPWLVLYKKSFDRPVSKQPKCTFNLPLIYFAPTNIHCSGVFKDFTDWLWSFWKLWPQWFDKNWISWLMTQETRLKDSGEALQNTNISTKATMTTLATLANMVILSSLLTIANFQLSNMLSVHKTAIYF